MIYSGLIYPGSKRRVMDRILPLFPDGIEDWREPFFGSGAVTFAFLQSSKAKDCKRLLVGDLAPEIWAYHYGCKTVPNEAVQVAKDWFNRYVPTYSKFINISPDSTDYDAVKLEFEAEGVNLWNYLTTIDTSKLSIAERCARTFITYRISFSGMGDSGNLSKMNLAKFRLEHTNKIKDISTLLERVEIINEPFQVTMADTDASKSFVFLDPPYYAQEGSGLYGKNGNTHRGFAHEEFAEYTKSLNCKWFITYDDSPFVRRLFRGYNIVTFQFNYTLAGKKAEDALAGEELLIANYKIESDESYDDLDDIL